MGGGLAWIDVSSSAAARGLVPDRSAYCRDRLDNVYLCTTACTATPTLSALVLYHLKMIRFSKRRHGSDAMLLADVSTVVLVPLTTMFRRAETMFDPVVRLTLPRGRCITDFARDGSARDKSIYSKE